MSTTTTADSRASAGRRPPPAGRKKDGAKTDTTTASAAWLSWIRPWYIGAVIGGHIEGHIYPDCQRLLRGESTPREGAGWLDPNEGPICGSCLTRHNAGEERPS